MKIIAVVSAIALSGGFLTTLSSFAHAKGCGGYVNIAVWGCAPWDNNDSKKQPIKAQPVQEVERKVKLGPGNTPPGYVITKPGTPGYNFRKDMVSPAVPPSQWHPNDISRR